MLLAEVAELAAMPASLACSSTSQAGRRSQYGPREVELQAKLAGMAANSATSASNIYNQQGAFQDRTLSSGLDVLN
jgi:hypothetical protein